MSDPVATATQKVGKFFFEGPLGEHGWFIVVSEPIKEKLAQFCQNPSKPNFGREFHPNSTLTENERHALAQALKGIDMPMEENLTLFGGRVLRWASPARKGKTGAWVLARAKVFYQALEKVFLVNGEENGHWLFMHEVDQWMSEIDHRAIAQVIAIKEQRAELLNSLPQSEINEQDSCRTGMKI